MCLQPAPCPWLGPADYRLVFSFSLYKQWQITARGTMVVGIPLLCTTEDETEAWSQQSCNEHLFQ